MEEILKEFRLRGYEYQFKGDSILFQKTISPVAIVVFKYDTKDRLLSPKKLLISGETNTEKIVSYTTNEALMLAKLFNYKRAD